MSVRIALVTGCAFPVGGPETNRFITYCKAFAGKGLYSKVYVLLPTENKLSKINKISSGQFDGVYFQYVSSMIKTSGESRFHKGFFLLFNIFKTFFLLRKDKIDILILYWGSSFIIYTLFAAFSKIFRMPLLIDRGEYPSKRENLSVLRDIKEKIIFKYFDGLIVMASNLLPFYDKIKRKKAKIFHLPMTVDFDRFKSITNVSRNCTDIKYIACIFGTHNRDCILDTIKAFKYYYGFYKEDSYQLWLIGNLEKLSVCDEIKLFLRTNELNCKVIIKGVLPSNVLPPILQNSQAVITTARTYNSGGFPSKIGEYLASKSPVIATGAGELPDYLKDNINALVAPPGDIIEIGKRIVYLHENTNICKQIGLRGYETAKKYFDINVYIDDLIIFLENLASRRRV